MLTQLFEMIRKICTGHRGQTFGAIQVMNHEIHLWSTNCSVS